jgi:putative DNA primase/helicase
MSTPEVRLSDVDELVDEEAIEAEPERDAEEPPATRDDIGNAERFCREHGQRFRHVAAFSPSWRVWDGRRWAADEKGAHMEAAKATVEALLASAVERSGDERERLLRHAVASRSAQRLRAIPQLAATDARLARRPDEFDVDALALNVLNGTVDLASGALRPHDPADGLTLLAGAAYDPTAEAPAWREFLARVLDGDAELEAFLRRLAGLSAIGEMREHVLAILWGAGANGKTTLVNALRGALGDYAHAGGVELLLGGSRPGQATPELAELRARRFVTIAETREDGRLAAERVKALTGGDPVHARFLHGNPFTFEPAHTVWLQTNHRPRVDDDGEAMWRRLLLVPFTVTIPPEERDPGLGERLKREADGILAWVVQGAREYLDTGLHQPERVLAATADYRSAESTFSAWVEDCCILAEPAWTPTARLHRSYTDWASANGAPDLSAQALAERLSSSGLPLQPQRKRARGWQGIALRQDEAEV